MRQPRTMRTSSRSPRARRWAFAVAGACVGKMYAGEFSQRRGPTPPRRPSLGAGGARDRARSRSLKLGAPPSTQRGGRRRGEGRPPRFSARGPPPLPPAPASLRASESEPSDVARIDAPASASQQSLHRRPGLGSVLYVAARWGGAQNRQPPHLDTGRTLGSPGMPASRTWRGGKVPSGGVHRAAGNARKRGGARCEGTTARGGKGWASTR